MSVSAGEKLGPYEIVADAHRTRVPGEFLAETVDDLLKHPPLLAPIDAADNGPQVSLVEARASA
jgi:hypothetical protein